MTITVAIPAYNEENYIGDCIKAVLAAATDNLLEILVINNASTDKTAEVAAKFPKVRVINEPQKGLTKARQRALLEAKGDLLAFVDADNRVPAHWFSLINYEYGHYPNLVCLSGPYYYFGLPGWQNLLARSFIYTIVMPLYHLVGYMALGGNFVAKKSALKEIGGFDVSISFYGEDTNIARRLYAVGKVQFMRKFFVYASGRRGTGEGFFKGGLTYLVNYLSEVFLKKPVTNKYTDLR